MEIPTSIYDILLDKFGGHVSDAQQQELDSWLDADLQNARLAEEFARDWYAARWRGGIDHVSREDGWAQLTHKHKAVKRRHVRRIYLRAAACCAAVVCLAGVGWMLFRAEAPLPMPNTAAVLSLSSGEQIELKQGWDARVRNDNVYIRTDSADVVRETGITTETSVLCTLSVPVGGEQRVELPDGSTVTLNAGSKIVFPSNFGQGERRVSLVGGAFFDVARNEASPFVIHTEDIEVTVLGTSFDLSAYGEDQYATVTLVEGAVRVTGPEGDAELAPGEQYVLSNDSGRHAVRKVDTDIYTSWVNGLIRFDAMPLEQLMKCLGRYYGIDYTFADERLKNIRFTGGFHRHEALNTILDMIEEANDVSFRIDGNIVKVINK